MFKYIVKDVVSDYGIFLVDEDNNGEMIDICNSRANALKICEILNADLKHMVYEDSSIRELIELNSELQQKDDQLKQQLAEKEETIEFLETYLKVKDEVREAWNEKQLAEKDQDKISFAVEKLEATKSKVLMLKKEEYFKRYYEIEDIDISRNDVVAIIDNQIKQLKEIK